MQGGEYVKRVLWGCMAALLLLSGCGKTEESSAPSADAAPQIAAESVEASQTEEISAASASETYSDAWDPDSIWITQLYQKGEALDVVGSTMNALIEQGFATEADMSEMLSPGQGMEPVEMTGPSGETMTVTVMNPFLRTVTAGEAVIAAFSFFPKETGLRFAKTMEFGTAARDDVIAYMGKPEQETAQTIEYQLTGMNMLLMNVTLNFGFDTQLVEADENTKTVLHFENNVLVGMEQENTALLHPDDSALEQAGMDPELGRPSYYKTVPVHVPTLAEKYADALEKSGIDVEICAATGEIVPKLTILFPLGSAELTETERAALDEFIQQELELLLTSPYGESVKRIEFQGFADTSGTDGASGTYGTDTALSQGRAQAVLQYCVNSELLTQEQKQLLTDAAETQGYGHSDPVYTGFGTVDQDACRRVKVRIYLNEY